MSLGTSGTVYGFANEAIIDPNGEFAAFCSSTGGWLPLVCTMNCTAATDLLRDLFKLDRAEFEAKLSMTNPGAQGLLTVPFFSGERTPNLPRAKACFFGMDRENTRPENLLRSGVEGVTFGLRYGLDRLADHGVKAEKIVLSGGGANSAAWRQLVADVCNLPVLMFKQEEGAAFGAAMQALGMLNNSELVSLVAEHLVEDVERSCNADPINSKVYNELFQQYQRAVSYVAEYYDGI